MNRIDPEFSETDYFEYLAQQEDSLNQEKWYEKCSCPEGETDPHCPLHKTWFNKPYEREVGMGVGDE